MDSTLYSALGHLTATLGLSTTRVAVMFLLLPVFSARTLPALVRNALFIALAVVAIYLQPPPALDASSVWVWAELFVKEVFIGLCLGIFFGVFLWAFEAAGVLIDTQIGSTFAMLFDPIVGNEVTLFGELLGRWAVWLFLATGGLLALTGALLESFVVWPLWQPLGGFREAAVRLVEVQLHALISAAVMLAAPILLVLFLIDITMGLVNRYAQQFNVFFLSTSIKSMASLVLLMVLLPFIADVLIEQIDHNGVQAMTWLKQLIEPRQAAD